MLDGAGVVAKDVKSLATACRQHALSGAMDRTVTPTGIVGAMSTAFRPLRTARGLLQVSYLGRSLPEGDGKVVDKALRDHKALLGSEGPPPLEVEASIRSWAKAWSRNNFGRSSLAEAFSSVVTSGGASMEAPRSRGGHSFSGQAIYS